MSKCFICQSILAETEGFNADYAICVPPLLQNSECFWESENNSDSQLEEIEEIKETRAHVHELKKKVIEQSANEIKSTIAATNNALLQLNSAYDEYQTHIKEMQKFFIKFSSSGQEKVYLGKGNICEQFEKIWTNSKENFNTNAFKLKRELKVIKRRVEAETTRKKKLEAEQHDLEDQYGKIISLQNVKITISF